jgi:hypothetical protein
VLVLLLTYLRIIISGAHREGLYRKFRLHSLPNIVILSDPESGLRASTTVLEP